MNYCVFILTYKRPNNQLSYNYLRSHHYTGKIYFVVDDSDNSIEELRDNYCLNDSNCEILVFNKKEISKVTDTGLSKPYLNFAVFSRNAIEMFAEKLNYDYFVMLDDDLHELVIRQLINDSLKRIKIVDIDKLFDSIFEFMSISDKLAMLSPAQSIMFFNKHIEESLYLQKYRECGTCFFRRTAIKISWKLNMLEDVITSYQVVRSGYVASVLSFLQAEMAEFYGKNAGGNSAAYLSTNRLDCIFPTIAFPESFYIYIDTTKKYSRCVNTDYLCPMILSGRFKL